MAAYGSFGRATAKQGESLREQPEGKRVRTRRGASQPVQTVRWLQRTIGNAAVSTLVHQNAVQRAAEEEEEAVQTKRGSMAAPVQRAADEEEEEESVQTSRTSMTVQRQADEEEEEEAVQTTRTSMAASVQRAADEEEEEESVQTKRAGSVASATDEAEDPIGERIRGAGGGRSLEPAVQGKLESSLGADLSSVRVHTDGEADHLSRSVDAVAFTTGQNIFFRSGAYEPASPQGLHLLAHEASHTLQQSAGPVAGTPSAGGVSISDPGDRFERAAESAAQQVSTGPSEPTQRTATPRTGTAGLEQEAI